MNTPLPLLIDRYNPEFLSCINGGLDILATNSLHLIDTHVSLLTDFFIVVFI